LRPAERITIDSRISTSTSAISYLPNEFGASLLHPHQVQNIIEPGSQPVFPDSGKTTLLSDKDNLERVVADGAELLDRPVHLRAGGRLPVPGLS
jgi:hypothetical protein